MVLVMQIACYAEPAALRRWDPEVRTSSVKDDHELLLWSSKTNLAIVLDCKT